MWTPCTVLLSFLRTFLKLVTRGCSRHVFQLDPRHTCDFIARFCRTRARLYRATKSQMLRLSSCTLLRLCRIIAKFHYTDTDTDPTRTGPDHTKSAHIVGDELNSTTRTRPDRHGLFCGETPLGPCGSGRVRVVEFSSYPTTCADFVRVRSVSGPCNGI